MMTTDLIDFMTAIYVHGASGGELTGGSALMQEVHAAGVHVAEAEAVNIARVNRLIDKIKQDRASRARELNRYNYVGFAA